MPFITRNEYQKFLNLEAENVTLRAELERLTGPVCVMSDSNYETGQTLWREWFEGGGRKPPEIPADTSLMLTWIVAKFRAKLHVENATLRAELEEAQRQLKIWESNEPCPECGEDHKCGTQATVARLTGERDALREQLSEAKIAYGKLFNENAALTSQLEEHEAE